MDLRIGHGDGGGDAAAAGRSVFGASGVQGQAGPCHCYESGNINSPPMHMPVQSLLQAAGWNTLRAWFCSASLRLIESSRYDRRVEACCRMF